jgi:hypothetical protein
MSESTLAGDIDESGFLNSLYRKGFTIPNAILELVANSLDANSTKLRFIISELNILMIDNGFGMNEDDLRKMFSMFRENHAGTHTRGVSGFGAKPSTLLLCKQQTMYIHTCKEGTTNYLTAIIPWDKIFSEKKYSNMIPIRPMSKDEQLEFITNNPDGHGTIIVLPPTNEARDAILNSFPNRVKLNTPAMDRIGIVFGNDTYECICDDVQEGKQVLKLYNYFGGNQVNYICGITKVTIQQWYHENSKHTRFFLEEEDKDLEIISCATGYSKDPKPSKTNLLGYKHQGTFTVNLALRNDVLPSLDPSNLVELGASFYAGAYDRQYFDGTVLEDYYIKNKLVRNNQRIGYFETPDITESSARGNAISSITYRLLQVELSYNPTSEQNNQQDIICNIQDVKNQWNGKTLPITLTRFIRYLRQNKGKSIMEFYNTRYNELMQSIKAASVSEHVASPKKKKLTSERKKPVVAPVSSTESSSTEVSSTESSSTEVSSTESSSTEVSSTESSSTEVSSTESSSTEVSSTESSSIEEVSSSDASSVEISHSDVSSIEASFSTEVSLIEPLPFDNSSIEVSSPSEHTNATKINAYDLIQALQMRLPHVNPSDEWIDCFQALINQL